MNSEITTSYFLSPRNNFTTSSLKYPFGKPNAFDRYGQYFIVPDIELGTYWTNTSLPDETVIDLYHAHGESEQYHSEIKTDMDVERLPSGKFESNKLVLELTMIAYNILRIIGQDSLEIYFQASL